MMIHDVVSAAYQGSYRIEVTFDDGERGIVDFTPYLKRGVFQAISRPGLLSRVPRRRRAWHPNLGDEIDITPETLYAEATGAPLPDWMTKEEPLAGVGIGARWKATKLACKMRASLPGEYLTLPPTASQMYFPEVWARGRGEHVYGGG